MEDVREDIDALDKDQLKLALLDFGVDFEEIEPDERLKAKLLDIILMKQEALTA